MSHNISFASGRAEIAFFGATPWHRLGTPLPVLATTGEILEAAGLDWEVAVRPIRTDAPPQYYSDPETRWKAVVRTDTEATLGIVSRNYRPVQNAAVGGAMDAVVAEGGAVCEVAGALGQGETCWILAQLPDTFEVGDGDEVRPYVLATWGHDGKRGVSFRLTPVRVVCANTLASAERSLAAVSMRHVGDTVLNVAAARNALGLVRRALGRTQEAYRTLAARGVDISEYLDQVVPLPPTAAFETAEELVAAKHRELRLREVRGEIVRLFDGGRGAELSSANGTLWGAYNAVCEYVDHTTTNFTPAGRLLGGKGFRARNRSALFGAGADLKVRALRKALVLAR